MLKAYDINCEDGKSVETHLDDMTKKIDKINNMKNLTTERLNKDENGIFKTLQFKNSKNEVVKRSILSGGTSPKYSTRIVEYYDKSAIIKTVKYNLNYDYDEILISEVIKNE